MLVVKVQIMFVNGKTYLLYNYNFIYLKYSKAPSLFITLLKSYNINMGLANTIS